MKLLFKDSGLMGYDTFFCCGVSDCDQFWGWRYPELFEYAKHGNMCINHMMEHSQTPQPGWSVFCNVFHDITDLCKSKPSLSFETWLWKFVMNGGCQAEPEFLIPCSKTKFEYHYVIIVWRIFWRHLVLHFLCVMTRFAGYEEERHSLAECRVIYKFRKWAESTICR